MKQMVSRNKKSHSLTDYFTYKGRNKASFQSFLTQIEIKTPKQSYLIPLENTLSHYNSSKELYISEENLSTVRICNFQPVKNINSSLEKDSLHSSEEKLLGAEEDSDQNECSVANETSTIKTIKGIEVNYNNSEIFHDIKNSENRINSSNKLYLNANEVHSSWEFKATNWQLDDSSQNNHHLMKNKTDKLNSFSKNGLIH